MDTFLDQAVLLGEMARQLREKLKADGHSHDEAPAAVADLVREKAG